VNTERRRIMRLTLAALVLAFAAACGTSSEVGRAAEIRSAQRANPLDELAIELRVPESAATAEELPTTMALANPSDHAITDPACERPSYRYALVPESEPDSDLWQAVIVDCGGLFTMEPGYKAEFDGPTIIAATRYGVPLDPGKYVATVEWSAGPFQRLTYPVTVTEAKRP
jgi:hypothetical protein